MTQPQVGSVLLPQQLLSQATGQRFAMCVSAAKAHGRAWPRLLESSFTKCPCLADSPKPWTHRDVLLHLLSSVEATSRVSFCWVLGACSCEQGKILNPSSTLSHLPAGWQELEAKDFCPTARSRPHGQETQIISAGLQSGVESFPESGFLRDLWCWFVARQNKQTLENQLKTKLLEDPRKWLPYFSYSEYGAVGELSFQLVPFLFMFLCIFRVL